MTYRARCAGKKERNRTVTCALNPHLSLFVSYRLWRRLMSPHRCAKQRVERELFSKYAETVVATHPPVVLGAEDVHREAEGAEEGEGP